MSQTIDRIALIKKIQRLEGLTREEKSSLVELLHQKKYGYTHDNIYKVVVWSAYGKELSSFLICHGRKGCHHLQNKLINEESETIVLLDTITTTSIKGITATTSSHISKRSLYNLQEQKKAKQQRGLCQR